MAPLPDLIGAEIAHMVEIFKLTKNPAAAWHAYSVCRKASRPVPDVIQTEVDRFAACVSENVEKAITDEFNRGTHITLSHRKIKHGEKPYTVDPVNFRERQLYKVWRGRFGGNPVGSLQDEWRDYGIAEAVRLLTENGETADRASEIVAKRESINMGGG